MRGRGVAVGADELAADQVAFQEELPLSMFVFPVHPDAELPEVFVEHAARPDDVLELPPEEIGANRERWIDEWTDVVLR